MNTLRIPNALAAAVIALAVPATSQATVPVVDPVGKAAQINCGVSNAGAKVAAAHADKIIFSLTGGLPAVDPNDQTALDKIPRNMPLDIKVLDNPRTVADLKGKVLSFIGAVDNLDTRQAVTIVDVEYAMVCAAANPL